MVPPMSKQGHAGLWDIVLYAVAMNFGIRWIATGAATGPVALPIWIAAAGLFLAPLVIATMELSARYRDEGAVYAWTRHGFGPFAGFVCGWIYWACNLPFFSGQLVFIVNLAGRAAGGEVEALLSQPLWAFLVGAALVAIIGAMHMRGLGVGKWLPMSGAIASLGLLVFLVGAGLFLAGRDGSATDFAAADYTPTLDANGAILWSTIVFAYGGAEGVALLRNEARGGVRQIALALVLVGIFLALAYVLGTAAMLMILPQAEASRLGGLPESLELALQRLSASQWRPWALGALAFALLGSMSAWFGAAARLPFAAGLDRMLPAALGRLDPKTGAPTLSIMVQTMLVIALLALSLAGSTLEAAYDFLVAMSVLSYTLPFLFLFAAYWKVQSQDGGQLPWRMPGGAASARWVAAAGFAVSLSAIFGAMVPSPDAPDGLVATAKLLGASFVLLASGAGIYWLRALGRKP